MAQSAPPSTRADIKLALPDLDRAFPFSILVNAAGRVTHLGPSFAKLARSDDLLGESVFDVVTFRKPRRIDAENLFQGLKHQRLTCDIAHAGDVVPISLYGTAFVVDTGKGPNILIALTPGVNARVVVEDMGLRMSDFGAADGSADLLPLLAMQAQMLEDSKKKSERLAAARDDMESLANQDALTGLPNRRALLRFLDEALAQGPLSLLHIDLDRFKEINDTHGHAAGDVALRHAADALCKVFGDDAMSARIGGDEFVAVLKGEIAEDKLHALAHKTIATVSLPFAFAGEHLSVGASIGLAQSTGQEKISSDELLHYADLALYEVKRAGRGNVQLCTVDLLSEHRAYQDLATDVRRGLSAQEFVAYLQPQIDVSSDVIIGFEALARWRHPQNGLMLPDKFLGAIERSGLIQDLDAQIRGCALDAVANWDANGIVIPKISLNVTTQDLLDPNFGDILTWDLQSRDMDPSRVVLEIVESVLFDENASDLVETCRNLVDQGFTLALDDFGTGHASILSLVHLPISIVKVDRVFASGISSDARKRALAQSMIEMTHSLDLTPLAEGVDSPDDVETLQALGYKVFQGFHLGAPMAAQTAFKWMVDRTQNPSALRSA